MKAGRTLVGCVVVAAATAGGWCRAQGSLAPPGAPQPTMKTLQELWDALAALRGQVAALSNQMAQITAGVSSLTATQLSAATPSPTTLVSGNGGVQCSLAFAPDGRPAVSFCANSGFLTYAAFDGARWKVETVDSHVAAFSTSLAFSPGGTPSIAYYDDLAKDLLYAARSATGWTTARVNTNGQVGATCSLVFDGANPLIGYAGRTNGVYLARWVKPAWVIEQVYRGTGESGLTSLALTPGGLPAICFYDKGEAALHYGEYNGARWVFVHVQDELTTYPFCSLAFAPEGDPAIGYCDYVGGLVRYARRGIGGTWTRQTVDSSGSATLQLRFSPAGRPAIGFSHDNGDHDVLYAEYDGSQWQVRSVDTGTTGGTVSLAFAPSGRAALCYAVPAGGADSGLNYAEVIPAP